MLEYWEVTYLRWIPTQSTWMISETQKRHITMCIYLYMQYASIYHIIYAYMSRLSIYIYVYIYTYYIHTYIYVGHILYLIVDYTIWYDTTWYWYLVTYVYEYDYIYTHTYIEPGLTVADLAGNHLCTWAEISLFRVQVSVGQVPWNTQFRIGTLCSNYRLCGIPFKERKYGW